MSTELYFDKVSRIEKKLPAIINLDNYDYSNNPFPYEYIEAENAQGWKKDIGQLKTIEVTTVDMFKTAEKIFGKRPTSAQYVYSHGGERFFDAYGNELGELTPAQFDPYRYKKQFKAYVYDSERIGVVDNAYNLPVEEGIVTYNELLDAVMSIVKEEDEFYPYIGEKVWVILNAADAVKSGGLVHAYYGY